MRKRLRIVLLSAIVAAVVVPVGFALSLDTTRANRSPSSHAVAYAHVVTAAPVTATTSAAVAFLPELPEGVKLFVAGSVLLGLAAAVRRTT